MLSEDLRKKVLDALFGAEEEYEYTSTTTPAPAAAEEKAAPSAVLTADVLHRGALPGASDVPVRTSGWLAS